MQKFPGNFQKGNNRGCTVADDVIDLLVYITYFHNLSSRFMVSYKKQIDLSRKTRIYESLTEWERNEKQRTFTFFTFLYVLNTYIIARLYLLSN